MVLGALLGAGIGLAGGVTVGSLVFSGPDPKNYANLDMAADDLPDVAEELHSLTKETRQILNMAPAWTKWPDYERVAWINRMIATLWPHYNTAIENIVNESVAKTLTEVCEKSKMLEAINIEKMDLGAKPLRIGGIKTYETRDDEVIIESPILWGSNSHVRHHSGVHSIVPRRWDIRVSAQVRIGPVAVYIPVEIKNIQLHALARITIRPLVETLPCLGALSVSLLDPPHIDMVCTVINNIDIMSIPGIHGIVHKIVQNIIGNMMLFPNQFKVDLMEGGGLPLPPCGMLRINLIKMEDLKRTDFASKNDAYCLLEVREGRPQRSKTVKSNSPVYEEEFHLIVDDPDTQTLKLTVKDEDFGWTDNIIGCCEVGLEGAEFVRKPREPQEICVELVREDEVGVLAVSNKVVKLTTFGMMPTPSAPKKKRGNLGKVYLELTYFPFFRPENEEDDDDDDEDEEDDEEEEEAAGAAAAPGPSSRPLPMRRPTLTRIGTMTNIRDNMKGLLTVALTRCLHLAGKDTYVNFTLFDKEVKKTETQRSLVVLNDSSPRWGDKFDFVMINANSILTVTVMEKPGFMESMMTMKFVKKEDKPIGKVRIPVKDVVRNGRLKDVWALQEVQQGEIALALTWTPCEFA